MKKRYATTIERTRLTAAATAAAVLLVAADAAVARPRVTLELLQAEPVSELAPAQRGVSLGQATSIALSQFPGRVVRAATIQMGDRMVHEIRILGEDGRTVRTFRIDAQTGSFL